MKHKIRNKKLKGMTLVEVIVALAVFSIMCAGMAKCATSVNIIVRDNIYFNQKMNAQNPVIDVKDATANVSTQTFTVTFEGKAGSITLDRFAGNEVPQLNNGLNFSFFQEHV